LYKPTAADTS